MDDVHRRRGPCLESSISGEQVEGAGLPGRFANQPQPLGSTAPEHVASEPVATKQPGPRLAHRVEPLKPHLKAKRDFLGARVGF
jgi:hypothetical protein